MVSNWKEAIEQGETIEAFEVVYRYILLEKLMGYGIGGAVGKWVEDYLTEKKQIVKITNYISQEAEIRYGVTQSSVLRSLLCSIYINYIVSCISECNIQMFADGTLIYKSEKDIREVIKTLNKALILIAKWMDNNQLKLNISKSKHMMISSRNNP